MELRAKPGLGTWECEGAEVSRLVYNAIKCGYRYIDCAYEYGNEVGIGQGIRQAIEEGLVRRDELFVATKLWETYHKPDLVEIQCRDSLHSLQLDYIDLFIVHWPLEFVEGDELYPRENGHIELDNGYSLEDTWHAMELLVDKGLARHIGVSNYCVALLLDLLSYCRILPFSNEIEVRLFLQQEQLVDFCLRNGIIVTAYSPLGGNYDYGQYQNVALSSNATVERITKKYDCKPAEVALAWHRQAHDCHNYNIIVKSSSLQRLQDNLQSTIVLNEEDLFNLRRLDVGARKNDAGTVFWETPVFE